MRDDFKRIGARVMRPERPRLAEARAVVIGLSDVREAWQALIARGMAPAPWESYDPGAFRGRGTLGTGAEWQPATFGSPDGASPAPPSIDDAVALASDPEGIARASLLATEHYARARPWRGPKHPERCPPRAWAVLNMSVAQGSLIDPTLWGFYNELLVNAPQSNWYGPIRDQVQRSCRHLRAALSLRFLIDVQSAVRWQILVEKHTRSQTTGALYADMADPTEPSMQIWSLGYALGNLTPDKLSMIAPGV